MTSAPQQDATVSRSGQTGPVCPIGGAPMTDIGSSRPEADTSRVAYNTGRAPTAWTGWVVFAALLMVMLGTFQALAGLVAIFNHSVHHVHPPGLVVHVEPC